MSEDVVLFYATNRKHKGRSRWNPEGYGTTFSNSGRENLRFGQLSFQVNRDEVNKHLYRDTGNGRIGDGEELSSYLSKEAENANIVAYKDHTDKAKAPIPPENNASSEMFYDLKKRMEEAEDVLVYIHGYNVEWSEAVGAATALQYMLNRERPDKTKKKVLVVLFSWPSDGSMMPFAAYKSDRRDARDSGYAFGRGILKLRDFLWTLRKNEQNDKEKLCGQEIHLLCHSMGNYVLQNTLKKMIKNSPVASLPRIFQHIFMCAPDVDDEVLSKGESMGRLHEICGNITVYFNEGDLAMYASDYTKGNDDRLGHKGNAYPSTVHNKVQQVDCSLIVEGLAEHSYYLWATVNDDIRFSIENKPFSYDKRGRVQNRSVPNSWTLT